MKVGDLVTFPTCSYPWKIVSLDNSRRSMVLVAEGHGEYWGDENVMTISFWLFEAAGGNVYGISPMRDAYKAYAKRPETPENKKAAEYLENVTNQIIRAGTPISANGEYHIAEINIPVDKAKELGVQMIGPDECCQNHWPNPLTGVCPDCKNP
jgi:hypothetical protein